MLERMRKDEGKVKRRRKETGRNDNRFRIEITEVMQEHKED